MCAVSIPRIDCLGVMAIKPMIPANTLLPLTFNAGIGEVYADLLNRSDVRLEMGDSVDKRLMLRVLGVGG
jgi:hypothetical protein